MARPRRAQTVLDSTASDHRNVLVQNSPAHGPFPRPPLISDSPLSLAQWLDVSWFYPDGFTKERIIETPRSWIVLGNGIAYKFLKGSPEEGFAARWRAACEEVLDNIALAPDLYLGLRVLRWFDEEPEWTSEYRTPDLDPLRPPPHADDAAIIMRRVPEGRMLHHDLQARNSGTLRTIREAASRIRAFHSRQQAGETFPLTAASLRRIYLNPLENYIASDAHSLDTFSHIALREIAFWLRSFLEHEDEVLRARRAASTVIDCHGSLRADRIASLSFEETSSEAFLFGRLPRGDGARVNDLLSDVAALGSDLRARGHEAHATAFEKHYFQRPLAGSELKLYHFFLVAESVRRATLILSGAVSDPHSTATSYLALATRGALQLQKPFLIALSGECQGEAVRLAQGLNSYVGCVSLAPRTNHSPALRAAQEDLELDVLLTRAERRLQRGESVALLWPAHRRAERERIEQCARAFGVPLLIAHIESDMPLPGKSERNALETLWGRRRPPGKARELFCSDNETPLFSLSSELHPADAALAVLHALRQHLGFNRFVSGYSPTRTTSPLRYSPSG